MFPKSYFGAAYYVGTYWPPASGITLLAAGGLFPFPWRRRGRR